MPRHLIKDAHEWNSEVLSIYKYSSLKFHSKKTVLILLTEGEGWKKKKGDPFERDTFEF